MLRFLRKSAPIDIFESISTDDHRALARVSDIVEGKLSYPRQNGLAVALRELGRIERTLFILDWLQSVELRRRVQAGLNKGEARNALARAVFFNRLGEIRDRSFEQQRYRASGLNLVTAAIVLWNTAYLERATNALNGHGKPVDETLFQYLSPLGWEHINLTGDYLWRSSTKVVNVGVRDSTYVLDGLLYHESDLRIEEHYTDTAGFTDHVFGLMHLLGFRFAPRIRDLGDTKLFIPKGDAAYDALKPMISSDRLNIKQIRAHWDEILRFATSIKQGTVTASLMLRKLGSYPRQNGLAVA